MSEATSNINTSSNEANSVKSDLSKKIAKSKESIEQEKKNFLNLYVEMLKNQDPSSPMDYSQMANMTLSFQNTSNILDIKELLQTKLQENDRTKLVDMAGLVGREVIVQGNELELKTKNELEEVEIRYELPKKVKKATLIVKNQEGEKVSEVQVLDKNQGINTYIWERKPHKYGEEQPIPNGKYTYEIKAEGFEGEEVKATTYRKKLITGAMKNYDGSIIYQAGSSTFDASKILGIISNISA